MKVIKPGKEVYNYTIEEIKSIKCEKCGCVFEYTNKELMLIGSMFTRIEHVIDCPNCGKRYVDLKFEEEEDY